MLSQTLYARNTPAAGATPQTSPVAATPTAPAAANPTTPAATSQAPAAKAAIVKIIDRGPSQPERVIDVSKAAAAKLGFVKAGSAEVSLQVVGKAKTGTSKKR